MGNMGQFVKIMFHTVKFQECVGFDNSDKY